MVKRNTTIIIVVMVILILMNPTLFGKNQSVVDSTFISGFTSQGEGHRHSFTVDIEGDGITSFLEGHNHEIFHFVVLETDGHTHTLAR